MNKHIFFGAVLGCVLLPGAFYFAPNNLFYTWQSALYTGCLIEVTIACYILHLVGPSVLKKSWGMKAWRTCFWCHSALYAFAAGMGIAYMLEALGGNVYSVSLVSTLLFGCAVGASTFAFDLLICATFVSVIMAPPIYVSFFVLPDTIVLGGTCVMSVLFFNFLAWMIHNVEVGALEKEETIRKQAAELKSSNALFQSTLDNIDEIFLTIDLKGFCFGNISEKAEAVLGLNPTGRHFTEVLRLNGDARNTAESWFTSLVGNLSYFQNLKTNGPQQLVDLKRNLTFRVRYFPMQQSGSITAVIMTLTDVTSQLRAQRLAETAEARAALTLSVSENRILFGKFLSEIDEFLKYLTTWDGTDFLGLRQKLHTQKGAAGLFQLRDLAAQINLLELEIKKFIGKEEVPVAAVQKAGAEISAQHKNWLTNEKKLLTRLRVFAPEEIIISSSHAEIVRRSFADSPDQLTVFDRVVARLKAQSLRAAVDVFGVHVEKLARKFSKIARYEVKSGPDEVLLLDESYLTIVKSMIHLINNAMDHGMETPQEREEAGKAAAGAIHISFVREKNWIRINLGDDGRGIDVNQLREALVTKQIHLEKNDDQSVLQSIFLAGLTTKTTASEISGHGMGLSALFEDVKRVGGRIEVATELKKGTTFTIWLPLDPTKVVLVSVGSSMSESSSTTAA